MSEKEPKEKKQSKEKEKEANVIIELPAATVDKILKKGLTSKCIVAKDSKAAFGKAAKHWIVYLTHTANDYAQQDGKTTISMHHVKKALEEMEFSQFQEDLDEAYKVYKAVADEKKANKSPKDVKKGKGKKSEEQEKKGKKRGEVSEEGNDHGSESS